MIDRARTEANTSGSGDGSRWGSVRSVSDASPTRTSLSDARSASALSFARARRVGARSVGRASIERDVSTTKSASAPTRICRTCPRAMTGSAAARPTRTGTRTSATSTGRRDRRVGERRPSRERILVARRTTPSDARSGTTPTTAMAPASGARNWISTSVPRPLASASRAGTLVEGTAALGPLRPATPRRHQCVESELEVVLRVVVPRIESDSALEIRGGIAEQGRAQRIVDRRRGRARARRGGCAAAERRAASSSFRTTAPSWIWATARRLDELRLLVGDVPRMRAAHELERPSKRQVVVHAEHCARRTERNDLGRLPAIVPQQTRPGRGRRPP